MVLDVGLRTLFEPVFALLRIFTFFYTFLRFFTRDNVGLRTLFHSTTCRYMAWDVGLRTLFETVFVLLRMFTFFYTFLRFFTHDIMKDVVGSCLGCWVKDTFVLFTRDIMMDVVGSCVWMLG